MIPPLKLIISAAQILAVTSVVKSSIPLGQTLVPLHFMTKVLHDKYPWVPLAHNMSVLATMQTSFRAIWSQV